MMYLLFDYYDKDRLNSIKWKTKKVFRVDDEISRDGVTYKVVKIFKKKALKKKCVEIRMIRYKIPDTATSFIHKCPARKGNMEKMKPEKLKDLKEKFGESTIKSWVKDGRVKMHGMKPTSMCPECKCVFYKDKVVVPETVSVTSLSGKKRLKKRS